MDVEEALRANVKGKIQLKELELVWEGDVDDSVLARRLLEQLEPHENVETLSIARYGGTRFPYWIDGGSPFLGVVTLELYGCRHRCQLPSLGQLVHLKKLSITAFPRIISIGPEFYGRCTFMKKPFQYLEVLRFENMPQWQEWVICGNEEEDFPRLQELYIINCPAFKQSLPRYLPSLTILKTRECERLVASLPRVPRILEMHLDDLSLRDGFYLSTLRSQSPLLERIEQLGCCGLFNNLEEVRIEQYDFLKCFPLESFSNLKHLSIKICPNFETINGNNISLLSLEVKECPNLVSFPEVGLKTPTLQRLELKDCSNLKWLRDMHYCLPSLSDFVIVGYRHAECFPEESLLPPTLTSLEIGDFPNLKSLEYKGFQHLTSLRSLSISRCPELQLLPEQGLPSSLTCLEICDLLNLESVVNSKIQQLTNLKELSVSECPKLKSVSEEGLPSSLTRLEICDLQNLESVVNNKIQQFTNLKHLSIGSCPKLKSVPEEGLPSTITSLKISRFADLESLNFKGLQSLTSLQYLEIYTCPKLQSSPEEGLPASLSYLDIWNCPLLSKSASGRRVRIGPRFLISYTKLFVNIRLELLYG